MASGIGISLGKAVGDLADGVGVRVSISRPLANVVTAESGVSQISSVTVTKSGVSTESRVSEVSGVSAVADGSISRNVTVSVVNTSHNTSVVGMAGGKGISLGKAVGDLADGVGVRVSISRPLANVVTAESRVCQISSVSVTISGVSTESRVSEVSGISGVSAVADG